MSHGTWHDSGLSRRHILGLGLGAATAPLLAACGANTSGGGGGADTVSFLSTQFTPVDERQRFEDVLKKKVSNPVAYNPVDPSTFATTFTSQAQAGKIEFSLVGGLHGELAPHTARLAALDDLLPSLADRGIAATLTDLGKLGGTTTKYIPWMQASYILLVNKKALQWLPAGADPQKLTYDQLLAWATAGRAGNGGTPILGFPAGPSGLYHRFFQGFLLPSFTGGQITTFRSAEAVQAWEYMRDLWSVTAPASTNYNNMQEPLGRGEVLIGWDHVARLAQAPQDKPDDWLAVPAPSGPKGLGYLLVVVGLGIPEKAPDPDRAKAVIRDLLTADTQLDVLRSNAFFPTVRATLPTDLPPAIGLEGAAVQAQAGSSNAILSLPPVGLGSKDGEVSQIFKDTFKQICIDKQPAAKVLDTQAALLNAILDQLKVPCWAPDPAAAVCRVP